MVKAGRMGRSSRKIAVGRRLGRKRYVKERTKQAWDVKKAWADV
jgi:hypothetical protein